MWFPKHAHMICRYAKKLEHDLLLTVYLMSGGREWAMDLSYQSTPRGMRSSTLLRGLINIHNKYVSSLWLMWVHGLYALLPFRNLLASSVPCIALSHIESWSKLRPCIQTPWYDTLYHTQASLYLPQNSHHTYLSWHFHSHSEIYCHATSTVPFFMTYIIIVILLCMII